MALSYNGNKVENNGATPEGRLPAAEYNALVAAVNAKLNRATSVALASAVWDLTTQPLVEITLSENTAITTTGVAATSRGVALVTNTGAYTLTINGVLQTIKENGECAIGVYYKTSGIYYSSDAGAGASGGSTNITPAAPTAGTVNDTLNTFTFTETPGYTVAAGDYEHSINEADYVPTTANPIEVGDLAIAIGALKVRVKAATGRNASADLTNAQAFTVAANTTPAAPTLAADDSANTLSASHALGTSEILVSEAGGAYQAYSGPIAVGDVARAIGYWRFKIKAAAGRNESPVADSPAFTVAAAEVGAYKTRLSAEGHTLSAGEESALTTFVQSLIDGGVYAKVREMYPLFIGTTAAHKTIAFKDGARNISSLMGSPAISNKGIAFAGGAYGVVAFNPSTEFGGSPYSTHIGIYVQGAADGGGIDAGVTDNYTSRYAIAANFSGSAYYQSGVAASAVTATPAAAGFYLGSRTAADAAAMYANGTSIGTSTVAESGGLPNGNVYLGAWNRLTGGVPAASETSTRTLSFVSFGEGLTGAEQTAFNTAVQTLATAMGFNV
jgi:hypothetical protein